MPLNTSERLRDVPEIRGAQAPSLASWIPLSQLLPCWMAMTWLVLETSSYWTNRPELQFGWIVLLLSVYLIWEAWLVRPPLVLRWTVGAVTLAVAGLALAFVFQVYRMAFGTTPAALYFLGAAVMLIVGANLLFAFGKTGLRRFAFAFGFLLVALPMPSIIYLPVVTGLQAHVAAIDVSVMRMLGIPAQQVGSLIRLASGTVGIDEACSGIRSLQACVMATLFIGYLTLKGPLFQVALLIAGILLAIVGNVIRSLVLSLVANAHGISAVSSVHDSAGWSVLLFTASGIALAAYVLGRMEKLAALSQVHVAQKTTHR